MAISSGSGSENEDYHIEILIDDLNQMGYTVNSDPNELLVDLWIKKVNTVLKQDLKKQTHTKRKKMKKKIRI